MITTLIILFVMMIASVSSGTIYYVQQLKKNSTGMNVNDPVTSNPVNIGISVINTPVANNSVVNSSISNNPVINYPDNVDISTTGINYPDNVSSPSIINNIVDDSITNRTNNNVNNPIISFPDVNYSDNIAINDTLDANNPIVDNLLKCRCQLHWSWINNKYLPPCYDTDNEDIPLCPFLIH